MISTFPLLRMTAANFAPLSQTCSCPVDHPPPTPWYVSGHGPSVRIEGWLFLPLSEWHHMKHWRFIAEFSSCDAARRKCLGVHLAGAKRLVLWVRVARLPFLVRLRTGEEAEDLFKLCRTKGNGVSVASLEAMSCTSGQLLAHEVLLTLRNSHGGQHDSESSSTCLTSRGFDCMA